MTGAMYNRILAAFQADPGGSIKGIARALGVHPQTVRRAYNEGGGEGLLPIRSIIAHDAEDTKRIARAARAAKAETAQARAAKADGAAEAKAASVDVVAVADLVETDRTRTLARLAHLCEGAREVAIGQLAVVAVELKAAGDLSRRVAEDLSALAKDPWITVETDGEGRPTKRRRMTPAEIIDMQAKLAMATDRTIRAALAALHMERLRVGLPTEIVQVDMPLEEAIAEIDGAYHELEQARARGLVALDGGKARNAQAEPSTAAG